MTNILSTYKYRYLFVYFLSDFMIYQLKTGSLTFSPMLYIVYGFFRFIIKQYREFPNF